MANIKLKIIIAEATLCRQIQIEKFLNRLGYYRILPIQNVHDLWALDHELIEPFDVLIANKSFVLSSDANLNLFWRATRKIGHSLFYDDKEIAFGDNCLQKLMARIDAPSPWECLKDLKWIKDFRHSFHANT